ncbi:MAG TPA: helix-hairpin-helix domain-containing protein [Anaerolineales bacterium]|nr:helix-hairpin-helix domain-containing protein [Anaerolineales bacterium]
MNDPAMPLNLNLASREELLAISGVNSTLADRILEARPFANLEDLQQVKGIGPRLYERIAAFVTVSPTEIPAVLTEAEEPAMAQADAVVDEIVVPGETAAPVIEQPAPEAEAHLEALPSIFEQPVAEVEALPEALPPVIEQPAPHTEPDPAGTRTVPTPPASGNRPAPAYVTRGQALWMMIGSAALSFLLAFGGVLLLLGLLNGGLRFARPADIEQLAGQVETLNTNASDLKTSLDTLGTTLGTLTSEVDTLSTEVETLDTRLEALDGPEGQVTQLGEAVTDVETGMETWELKLDAFSLTVDDLAGQVESLSTQAETLSLQVDALLTRTGRFQAFLDGLTSLLGTLMIPEDAPINTSTPEPLPPNSLPYPTP